MNVNFQTFRERWTASSTPRHPLDSELQGVANSFVDLVSSATQKTNDSLTEGANAPYSQRLATDGGSLWPGFTGNPVHAFQSSDTVPDTIVRSQPSSERPTRYSSISDHGRINDNKHVFNAVPSQSMSNVQPYSTESAHNLYDVPDTRRSRRTDVSIDVSRLQQVPAAEYDTEQHQVELTDVFKIPVSPQLAKELALPSSYSFTETSFTRRLMRSSIEAAYMTMLDPSPQDVERLCGYSCCFIQRPQLMAYFKVVMERTTRENLELWAVPLYHIGNAGLHYPRDGIDASSPTPAGWAQSGPIGPLLPRRGPTPVPDSMAASEVVDYAGVGGEWFDSNDVEQYLRTKGLKLDAQSSWAEIIDPSDETQGAAYQGHPQTLSSPSAAFDDLQLPQSMDFDFTSDTTVWPNDYTNTSLATDITNFTQSSPSLYSSTNAPWQMTDTVPQENPDLFTSMWNTRPKQMFHVDTFVKSKYLVDWPITIRLTFWQPWAIKVLAWGGHYAFGRQLSI